MNRITIAIIILVIIGGIFFAYIKYMPDIQNSAIENTNDLFPKPTVKDGITYSFVGKEEITRAYLLDGTEQEETSGYNISLVATKSDGSTIWNTPIFWSKMSNPEFLRTVVTEFMIEGDSIKISGPMFTKIIHIKTGELQKTTE